MSRPLLLGALFASLALNVFVVGGFVGLHLAQSRPAPDAGPAVRPRNPVEAAVRTLPPEARARWREEGGAFLRERGPQVRQARRLVRETMSSFGREPFDAAATLAALKRARALEYEHRLAMDARIVTFAATLTPEERAAFGDALARPGPRRGDR